MTKEQLIKLVSENIKVLRAEYDYSQQAMANAIGLSKKTLIQVEKERLLLSWTATCAACAVFKSSKFLNMTLGGDPTALVEAMAHKYCYTDSTTVERGNLFWDILQNNGEYVLEKNIISEHYRIIDDKGRRLFSTFDLQKANAVYVKYIEKGEN
ncbi:MAG: transcriptional regulator [Eubacteriales bacterium]